MVEPVFLLEGELLVQLQPAEIVSLPCLAFYFEHRYKVHSSSLFHSIFYFEEWDTVHGSFHSVPETFCRLTKYLALCLSTFCKRQGLGDYHP